jgi:ring-1,2-phenylacetyl-CoA epoxidase subunit PaaD
VSRVIPVVASEIGERRSRREQSRCTAIWNLLDEVTDPEIPVLSLWDLGVLQDVELAGDEVLVVLTPTYSGCPAMASMTESVRQRLRENGYLRVRVELRISPAWTTDWISADGREVLRAYGIAPPIDDVVCPLCQSSETQLISEFGSTACKALYRCSRCSETFDYFKRL